ncbi:hypothetical protein KJ991_02245 [Patescibacteria group bacterium]|nr:hypothetical protein [Patescibacteria group bacterium]MBU4115608.1 hypothetical protein [Patescibacteria group bacterium]
MKLISEKKEQFLALGGIWIIIIGFISLIISMHTNKETYEFVLNYVLSTCFVVGFISYLIADNNKYKKNKLRNLTKKQKPF